MLERQARQVLTDRGAVKPRDDLALGAHPAHPQLLGNSEACER